VDIISKVLGFGVKDGIGSE